MSSDHDIRHAIATELTTVAELLEAEDKIVQAIEAREAARALYIDKTLSANRAIKALCRLENLIGA